MATIQCNGLNFNCAESSYSIIRMSITRQKHEKPARRKVHSSNKTLETKFLLVSVLVKLFYLSCQIKNSVNVSNSCQMQIIVQV